MKTTINLCIPTLIAYESLINLILSAEKGSLKPDKYIVIDNDAKKNKYTKNFSSFKESIEKSNSLPISKIEIIEPCYNLGVAGSWNYFMKNVEDTIIISNDDIELSEKSLESFFYGIVNNPNTLVYSDNLKESSFSFFHLPKKLYEQIGEFDENFYPAYFEDCDYKKRLAIQDKKIIELENINLKHDASLTFKTKTTKELEEHHDFFATNKNYYIKKWGGEPNKETFSQPFNGKDKEIIIAFPTLFRYDLLAKAIETLENGDLVPDRYIVMDNGFSEKRKNIKGFNDYIKKHNLIIPKEKIEVINSPKNLGVAGSWNYFMKNYIDNILIISNDDIEFYKDTIKTLVEAYYGYQDDVQKENILMYTCNCHENNAFCLFLPLKKTIKVLGYIDENFYPAYFEDCDYSRQLGLNKPYTFYSVKDCNFNHFKSGTYKEYTQLELQKHHNNFIKNKNYYIKKWGGDLGEEKFTIPFNEQGWKIL